MTGAIRGAHLLSLRTGLPWERQSFPSQLISKMSKHHSIQKIKNIQHQDQNMGYGIRLQGGQRRKKNKDVAANNIAGNPAQSIP